MISAFQRLSQIFVVLFLILNFHPNTGWALNRDYCTFYVDSSGELEYDDLQYLDSNNDWEPIYHYTRCCEHFSNYYERHGIGFKKFLPNVKAEILNLIPDFQVPNQKMSSEFKCYFTFKLNKYCNKRVIYPGYLDVDFSIYNPFLEEQLTHFSAEPQCVCYWPELSEMSGEINDIAYLLFNDLFANTALSRLIEDYDEQKYLLRNFFWELNLHGLSVSCVCRSFWFSHYYQIALHILKFAKEDYQYEYITFSELKFIQEKIESLIF